MLFRDPRRLRPEYDRKLDTAVRAAAQLIATEVARFGHRRTPDDPGKWNSFAEQRAIDLVDEAIAKKRDDIDGVGLRTAAEREYDVALDRVRRDIEQLMRTAATVAEERGLNPHIALADQANLVFTTTSHLEQWVAAEVHPYPDAGEAGV